MKNSATQLKYLKTETHGAFRLGHRPELNGLRGAAILPVMLFHANESFLKAGYMGVDLFFVLSGFLITALLIEEYDNNGRIRLKNFYLRRVLRLAPALILFLIIYCAASTLLLGLPKAYSHWVDALIVLFYSTNWSRALDIHAPFYLGHAWSLSIEEQFYALWPPLLFLFLRKIRSRWGVALLALAIGLSAWGLRIYLGMVGATDMRLYNGLDTRADALMIGCLLGILVASGLLPLEVRGWRSRLLLAAGLFSFISLAGLTNGPAWNDPRMFHWLSFVIEVLTAVVILDCFINSSSVVRKVLSLGPLVWIGSISYGLYLWHYPIYMLLKDIGYSRWEVLALGSALTFAAATLSFYLLEKPFLRLKSRLETRATA